MKEILERHAARLAPSERQAIWIAVSSGRPASPLATVHWATVATAIAGLAAVAMVVTLMQSQPVTLQPDSPRVEPEPRRVTTLIPDVNVVPDVAPLVDGARAQRSAPSDATAKRTALAAIPPAARTADSLPAVAIAPSPPLAITPELEVGAPAVPGSPRPPLHGAGVVTGRITDRYNRPLPYANVVIVGEKKGAMSGEDGAYRISDLPSGTYTLRVQALGFDPVVKEGVQVVGEQSVAADIRMANEKVVKEVESIEVRAEKRIDTRASASRQAPTQSISSEPATKPQARGGREGEVQMRVDGLQNPVAAFSGPPASTYAPAAPGPPVIPTTGGTHLPNDEAFDSMFFKNYGVNPFIATDEDALSTFAVDVDAASYTLTRRYLELGQLPPADAVRVEEFVNYFPQGYPSFDHDDFRILVDGAPSPFGPGYHLLRIGLKGREVLALDRKPAQLTFVIDVSGSMDRENRLELVKRALRLLVDELRGDDRVGIVVYGTQAQVLLEPVAVGEELASATSIRSESDEHGPEVPIRSSVGRQRILQAIDRLLPSGSTNAEHGLQLGYDMARRHFRTRAINRIVLCSDGVANVGRTGPESILAQVRTEADRGIQLSTIGFGMGNYNDVLMEQLADRGDGNHYYVDDLDEAQRVFVENLTGTLQVIAKDAKVQVEFDSTRVLRYRLLGFENRDIADRDFRNDKVDAGEIGAGHEVTALYEIKLAPRVANGTLATVRLRYAQPESKDERGARVRELAKSFDASALSRRFEDAPPRFRLDAAIAECAELLRGSYWAREGNWADVLRVARAAAQGSHDAATIEFISLVERAEALKRKSRPEPSKR